MRSTPYALIPALIVIGCTTRESAPTPAPVAALPMTTTPAAPPTTAMPAPGAAMPAPAAGQPALATQESNWAGVAFEVVEFRRRGNTLTAKLRVTNRGTAEVEPEIHYNEAYLMDAAAGKKYEVLKDEKGAYIAALHSGSSSRWYENLKPAQGVTIWMKFPAPPPEVKAVTLQVPGVPPFEELAIQDS